MNDDLAEPGARWQPPLTFRSAPYWHSGGDGTLRIARCGDCGRYQHPPAPVCPACRGSRMAFESVSGTGRIFSYTINRYPWQAQMLVPYVIAEVELIEQEGLLLISNIITDEPEAVQIDQEVHVEFEQAGDAWIPVFRA